MEPFMPGVEILEIIFASLDANTLTRVARVSRACHSAAIHVLWEILDDMLPLVRLLPKECLKQNDSMHMILARTPQPGQVTRFQEYGRHVKHISFRGSSSPLASFFDKIHDYTLFKSLNLKSLMWTIGTSPQCSALLQLVSSDLQELRIVFDKNTIQEMDRVINTLLRTKPSLTVLEIRLNASPGNTVMLDLRTGLVETLKTRASLTSLATEMSLFLPAIASHKSPFSNLTKLALDETLHWSNPAFNDIPSDIFPALREIYGQSIRPWNHLLVCTQNIEQITITRDASIYTNVREVMSLVQTIGNFCPELAILGLGSLDIDDHDDTALKGLLVPLFRCTKLQDLQIITQCDLSYSINDKDIDDMARSWPDLKRLELSCGVVYDFESPPPPPTLSSAFNLRRHCPQLEELSLTFDLRWIPKPTSNISPIYQLNFGNSVVEDPAKLASCLLGFVPPDGVTWDEGEEPYDEDGEEEQNVRRETAWKCTRSCLEALEDIESQQVALRKTLEASFAAERRTMEDTIRTLRLETQGLKRSLGSLNCSLPSAIESD